MEKPSYIYALCEPGTRTVRYIGKTANPRKRFSSHLRRSIKKNNHLGAWLRSLALKGETPGMEILDEVPGDSWEFFERAYIKVYREAGFDLTNATSGGEGLCNPTESARENIAAARRGQKNSPESRAKLKAFWAENPHPCLGRRASAETRARQSAAKKGKPQSPEAIEKRIAPLRGKPWSEARRAAQEKITRPTTLYV